VAELVDALDLGPSDFSCESSSLSIRIYNYLFNNLSFNNMTLPFTLQQLRILKAVASEKSFTRAAEILFVSQPSLSKQIKILENRLGIVLLNRENNSISLTEGGRVFLKYSERILALCEESCRALNDVKNGDRGNLAVGASQTIGTYLMPRVLALFAQNYPQINIKVQVDSTRVIAKNVVNREIDIAVVGGDVPEELKKNLEIENFVEDELILIVPKSHPFALKRQKKINKGDLYHLNFITLNSTSTIHKFIDNILIQNNIETKQFNIIMQLNSIEGIKTAVSLGLGAAFVSSSAIEKEIELNTVEIITIENIKITRTLSIITNRECYRSKAVEFFHNDLWMLKNITN
jgi:DNA-binding transcriptional LysR family regulator